MTKKTNKQQEQVTYEGKEYNVQHSDTHWIYLNPVNEPEYVIMILPKELFNAVNTKGANLTHETRSHH